MKTRPNPTNGNLDERTAVRHFLGMNREQARDMIAENVFTYADDLMFMGMPAFEFYYPAFSDYLRMDDPPTDDADISWFITIIAFRYQSENFSKELVSLVSEDVYFLIQNYSKYEVQEKFYGNLLEKLEELRDSLIKGT